MCFEAPNVVAPATPWTISIATSRSFLALAAGAAKAGVIASRKGSAIDTPSPLSIARRGRCFPVRYICVLLPSLGGRLRRLDRAPLECGAVDDPEHERRE